MTVKQDDAAFKKVVDDHTKKFLVAVGIYGVSVAVMAAPVVSGLYRNSLMYYLSDGTKSAFGNTAVGKKTAKPKLEEMVSQPEQPRTVRIGSGVIYANRGVEIPHGTLAMSFDTVSARLDELARKVAE